jgi:hypothetical protein
MFTYLAYIVAGLGLFFGGAQILMGFTLAADGAGPDVLGRYTTASTTGELIDRGMYLAVFAVALGTLAEIGWAVRRGRTTNQKDPA